MECKKLGTFCIPYFADPKKISGRPDKLKLGVQIDWAIKYVDSWPKILLFRTHHLWNSPIELYIVHWYIAWCIEMCSMNRYLSRFKFQVATLFFFESWHKKGFTQFKFIYGSGDVNVSKSQYFSPIWIIIFLIYETWEQSCPVSKETFDLTVTRWTLLFKSPNIILICWTKASKW